MRFIIEILTIIYCIIKSFKFVANIPKLTKIYLNKLKNKTEKKVIKLMVMIFLKVCNKKYIF